MLLKVKMAVLVHYRNPPVTFVDHEKYLTDLYSKDVGYAPKNVFDIKTPFRMDLEAEKVADAILRCTEDVPITSIQRQKRERKKKKRMYAMCGNDINDAKRTSQFLLKSLCYVKEIHPELFSENSTAEEIRENNRPVRSLVQSIHMSVSDLKYPLQGENSDMIESKVARIQGNIWIISKVPIRTHPTYFHSFQKLVIRY